MCGTCFSFGLLEVGLSRIGGRRGQRGRGWLLGRQFGRAVRLQVSNWKMLVALGLDLGLDAEAEAEARLGLGVEAK